MRYSPGEFDVAFTLINFAMLVRQDVRPRPGQTITLDVVLQLTLSADVTVSGWLTDDGSVRSHATSLLNAQASYRLAAHSRVVDLFNLLTETASDIDYFYTSRLPGEPPSGIDDIHTHPAVPRAARVTLQVIF